MASFYVSKYNAGWRVVEEVWKEGKRTQKTIPKKDYMNLGINPDWSIEKARLRIKELNSKAHIDRKFQHQMTFTSNKVTELKTIQSIFLPELLVERFTEKLRESTFGSANHQKRIFSHFKTVCEIIKTIKIEPTDYFSHKEKFYQYFIAHNFSPDYTNKLLRIVNLWGYFVCRERKQSYDPVPVPNDQIKNRIADSYQSSSKFVGESDPLTPKILQDLRLKSNTHHFNWLFLSLWFGLRPSEIDNLKNSSFNKIEYDSDLKIEVLWVYQAKLISLKKEDRWKKIPVIFEEQKKGLEIIKSQDFKRPSDKIMKTLFPKGHFTKYAGRKGFTQLMLSQGQILENISAWMGHQTIKTTWEKYRNKKGVNFTPIKKSS